MASMIDKTVTSKYQPKFTNVIWIDISGDKPVEKHFINGRWVMIGGGSDSVVGDEGNVIQSDGNGGIVANPKVNVNQNGDVNAKGKVSADGGFLAKEDVVANGNISAGGDVVTDGSVTAKGKVSAEGDVTAEGDVIVNGDGYFGTKEHAACIYLHDAANPPELYRIFIEHGVLTCTQV